MRVVVGAAVVRRGRLLAARRTEPPRLAGGWELPGGKVEPGESEADALVREVHEELGCAVEVGDRLADEADLGGGYVLHAYVCTLVDGEPTPTEHDAVRWLGPEELDDVAWLPVDRVLLPALRERLLDGEPLPGGNVGGAVRVGATVRRPAGPWSGAVHDLLRHLQRAGLRGVPRVLGTDDRGREVVSYLPGVVRDPDDWSPSESLLVEAATWLRDFHAAVADFRPPGGTSWRGGARPLGPDEIVCHHDTGTYNWAVDDHRLAGLIDWDMAAPGTPLDDLAFLAWTAVPLVREAPLAVAVHRLGVIAEAYGGPSPAAVAEHAIVRMTGASDRIAAGQAAGDPGMVALRRIGEPQRTQARISALRARLPDLLAALA